MDFLNFLIALHKDLGVEIPEKDYARLATLSGCLDYLARASLLRQGTGGGDDAIHSEISRERMDGP